MRAGCSAARPFVPTHFLHNKAICGRLRRLSNVSLVACASHGAWRNGRDGPDSETPPRCATRSDRWPTKSEKASLAVNRVRPPPYRPVIIHKRCTTDARTDDRCAAAVSEMRARYLRAGGYRRAPSIARNVTGRLQYHPSSRSYFLIASFR